MPSKQLKEFVADDITLTADATDQQFTISFVGSYLYQVEMLASLDTSVALTIKNDLGAAVYSSGSADWTLATGSGGIPQQVAADDLAFFPAVCGRLTYTVAGIGSGNFRFRVVGTRSPLGR